MDRKSDYAYASRGRNGKSDYARLAYASPVKRKDNYASRGFNRKGIANVVGIGLLILIGIVLIGVLWVYIYNSLGERGLFSPAFSCLEMQLNPTILITKACYNNETGDLEIGMRRDKDELNLKNFYLIFNSENGSRTYGCGEECGCEVLEEGSDNNYYISGNGNEKSVVLSVLNCDIGQREIAGC